MTEHYLKIEREHLEDLISGAKKAELRINDRDYEKGDILIFCYMGLEIKFKVTHVLKYRMALQENYVCLSVRLGE